MNTTETTNRTMEIAQTIVSQIKALDFWAMGAWGCQNLVALPESKEFAGGLRFKVNGMKFKGYVAIELRWVDDYTISFLNRKGEVAKKVEGVYCDQLVEIIDWIEGR